MSKRALIGSRTSSGVTAPSPLTSTRFLALVSGWVLIRGAWRKIGDFGIRWRCDVVRGHSRHRCDWTCGSLRADYGLDVGCRVRGQVDRYRRCVDGIVERVEAAAGVDQALQSLAIAPRRSVRLGSPHGGLSAGNGNANATESPDIWQNIRLPIDANRTSTRRRWLASELNKLVTDIGSFAGSQLR
jgi:hypothetical protein